MKRLHIKYIKTPYKVAFEKLCTVLARTLTPKHPTPQLFLIHSAVLSSPGGRGKKAFISSLPTSLIQELPRDNRTTSNPLRGLLLTLPMHQSGQEQGCRGQAGWGIDGQAGVQQGELTEEAAQVLGSGCDRDQCQQDLFIVNHGRDLDKREVNITSHPLVLH